MIIEASPEATQGPSGQGSPEDDQPKKSSGVSPRTRKERWTAGIFAFVLSVVIPLVVVIPIVASYLHPQISQDFLFLYFGITSALAIAVWSVLVLSEATTDKRTVFFMTILMNGAALFALVAAIAGVNAAQDWLDLSVSFLTVGLLWIFFQSGVHFYAAERRLT